MGDRWRFVAVGVTLAVLVVGWRTTLEAAPEPGPPVAIEGPASAAAPPHVVVHVAGAVLRPGLVELPSGARVADAILAAGGATSDARLDLINLATPVAADQQIVVPRSEGGTLGVPAGEGSPTAGGLVSLNRADAAELETLPGVGPVLAQRIIDHRSEVGPFAAIEDLLDVSGIGERTLANIRDLVTVP